MMKSVAVAALCFFAAVAAEADADADAYYAHGYGYYGHPYAYGHYYGKRSADAEPAADADAHYSATLATLLLWLLPPLCPPSTEVPSTDSPMAVSTATTTARGLLMPSPLLLLLPLLMPSPLLLLP